MATARQMGSGALDEVRARRAELHRAILDVELALARAAGRLDWLAGVCTSVARLRLALDDHVAITEGAGMLFEKILADCPRLAGAVRRLREEHVQLDADLTALGARLRAASKAPSPPADALRRAILPLLGRLARHRQRGADLLHEAYEVDIGGSAD